ncbi:PEP-CTERM sorting domain-containing protein [Novosphingobium sp. PS1R-30]|uniref:PEP-CTERM sorting domain-containing protein n=2 Tax=Novosphingobium anseongense TaxID=3133436 RepID=A0ABU8RZR3_9SPHN
MIRTLGISAVVSLLLAGPAHAAGSIQLPDPSGITLFSLGIAGLLIGRHFAGKRRD